MWRQRRVIIKANDTWLRLLVFTTGFHVALWRSYSFVYVILSWCSVFLPAFYLVARLPLAVWMQTRYISSTVLLLGKHQMYYTAVYVYTNYIYVYIHTHARARTHTHTHCAAPLRRTTHSLEVINLIQGSVLRSWVPRLVECTPPLVEPGGLLSCSQKLCFEILL
jgi:hypothetical protein